MFVVYDLGFVSPCFHRDLCFLLLSLTPFTLFWRNSFLPQTNWSSVHDQFSVFYWCWCLLSIVGTGVQDGCCAWRFPRLFYLLLDNLENSFCCLARHYNLSICMMLWEKMGVSLSLLSFWAFLDEIVDNMSSSFWKELGFGELSDVIKIIERSSLLPHVYYFVWRLTVLGLSVTTIFLHLRILGFNHAVVI